MSFRDLSGDKRDSQDLPVSAWAGTVGGVGRGGGGGVGDALTLWASSSS